MIRWLDKLWEPTMHMREDVGCLLAISSGVGLLTIGGIALYLAMNILVLVMELTGLCVMP